MPIASPIMNTSVWSAIVDGDVRKKYAMVIWKREMELMIVAPDIRAIFAVDVRQMKRDHVFSFISSSGQIRRSVS
jgi:hypothetical protein